MSVHSSQSPARRSSTEGRLRAIWSRSLARATFPTDCPFFDLGGTSRDASNLLIEVERAFGIMIPLSTLLAHGTFEAILGFINGDRQLPEPQHLVALQAAGTKPPLFCVHGVHGGALTYRRLPHWLGDDQPLYAFEARGFDNRQRPCKRLEQMTALYLNLMLEAQPHGPYFLCGYSFGGRIAYQLAHRLRQRGETVALLALLDTHFTPPNRRQYQLSHWRKQLLERCKRLKGTPPLTEIERSRRRVEHANYLAATRFVPYPYDGKITYLSARASRNFSEQPPREQGWERIALGGFTLHDIPGEHLTMFHEQYLPTLADTLRTVLQEAQRTYGI